MIFDLSVFGWEQMQDGAIALHIASQNGHLDVVSRLLECKEIDGNLQMNVSWIVVQKCPSISNMAHDF